VLVLTHPQPTSNTNLDVRHTEKQNSTVPTIYRGKDTVTRRQYSQKIERTGPAFETVTCNVNCGGSV
jgi:hypothetical protein